MLTAFQLKSAMEFQTHQTEKMRQMAKTFRPVMFSCDYLQEKTSVKWEQKIGTNGGSCLVSDLLSQEKAYEIAKALPANFFFSENNMVIKSSTNKGYRVMVNPFKVEAAMDVKSRPLNKL